MRTQGSERPLALEPRWPEKYHDVSLDVTQQYDKVSAIVPNGCTSLEV